ncbi:hypothetical protein BpHYR1_040437 [Brachionus plicatilis]|uniref:Uncharacterized protein n=1 Tax=Brachionus plicatilis TaxID=10195 RepID=A0A3M7QXL4_BRAPC|nr:hypothetical protein BpHYR1_040437 [Brachionus plicatilis]
MLLKKVNYHKNKQKIMLNLNFEIPETNLWWRPSYWPYSNQQIFTKIENFKNLLNDAKEDDEFKLDYEKTLPFYYQVNYIIECLKSEQNINENVSYENVVEILHKSIAENKTESKIKNIYNAVIKYCPDPFAFKLDISSFNVDLAKDLNKIIGKHIWNDAGDYRTKKASAYNMNYEYCEPEKISERLNKLFDETNRLLSNINLKNLESRIKIASIYSSIFKWKWSSGKNFTKSYFSRKLLHSNLWSKICENK